MGRFCYCLHFKDEEMAQSCSGMSLWHVFNSLLFLSPEVWFDDQTVHSKVDHERPHGGIEHSAGQKLIRQMNGEEVSLTSPV